MSALVLLFLLGFIIWVISLIGGFSAIFLHRKYPVNHEFIHLSEAFAGGIFLGAALFHMLPDAQAAMHIALPSVNYPFANLICALGFCVLLFLEHTIQYCYQSQNKSHHHLNILPLLLTLLISVHAISEGIALGVTSEISNMAIIFIAIAVHKSSEGFAVGTELHKGSLSFKKILLAFLLFSFMTPLGITLGFLATQLTKGASSELIIGIFNAFAAGTFLYIATLHKLYHHHKTTSQPGELLLTFLGLGLMALIALWM